MTNPTQKERVIKRLLDTGRISRNECLRVYISRLSAIIQDLENNGWVFTTKHLKGNSGKDYAYYVEKIGNVH